MSSSTSSFASVSSSSTTTLVIVAHDYNYEKSDGSRISIVKNQVFILVDRTNDSWWRVKPTPDQVAVGGDNGKNNGSTFPAKGFYVPAKYVKVVKGGDDEGTTTTTELVSGGIDERKLKKDVGDQVVETPSSRMDPIGEDRPLSPLGQVVTAAPSSSAPLLLSPASEVEEDSLHDALKKVSLKKVVENGGAKPDDHAASKDGADDAAGGVVTSGISFAQKKKNFESMFGGASVRRTTAASSAPASAAPPPPPSTSAAPASVVRERIRMDGVEDAPSSTAPVVVAVEGSDAAAFPTRGSDSDEKAPPIVTNTGESDDREKEDRIEAASSSSAKVGDDVLEAEDEKENEIDRYLDEAEAEGLVEGEEDSTSTGGLSAAELKVSTAATETTEIAATTTTTTTTTAAAAETVIPPSSSLRSPAAALVKSNLEALENGNPNASDRLSATSEGDRHQGEDDDCQSATSTTSNLASSTTTETAAATSASFSSSVASLTSTFEGRFKTDAKTSLPPPKRATPPTAKKFRAAAAAVIVETKSASSIFSDGFDRAEDGAASYSGDGAESTIDATKKSFVNPLFQPKSHQRPTQQQQSNQQQRPQKPVHEPPPKPTDNEDDDDADPVLRRPTRKAPTPVQQLKQQQQQTAATPSFENSIADEIKKFHRRSCMPDPGTNRSQESVEVGGGGGGGGVVVVKEKLGKRNSADSIATPTDASTLRTGEGVKSGGGDGSTQSKLSPGWRKTHDAVSNTTSFVFLDSGVRWFSGLSSDGKVYFYSEDRQHSAWTLPDNPPPSQLAFPTAAAAATTTTTVMQKDAPQRLNFLSPSSSSEELLEDGAEEDDEDEEGDDDDEEREDVCARLPSIEEVGGGGLYGRNDGNNNDVVRFKGWLNYNKLHYDASSKKSVKKGWNKGYLKLVSQWLVFYVNLKRSKPSPNHPFGKPEFKIFIAGAAIVDGKEKTKKSNALFVYVEGKDGAVLLQSDNSTVMDNWRSELQKAATASAIVTSAAATGSQLCAKTSSTSLSASSSPYSSIPTSPAQENTYSTNNATVNVFNDSSATADSNLYNTAFSRPRAMTDLQKDLQASLHLPGLKLNHEQEESQPQDRQQLQDPPPPPVSGVLKTSFKGSIFRKGKKRSGSGSGSSENNSSITSKEDGGAWLDSWFKKRPSINDVKERGIVKAGNVFGADLDTLVEMEAVKMLSMTIPLKDKSSQHHLVPSFVSKCVYALESRDLLWMDGVYRVNGNCAEIQKLRFLVDAEKDFNLMDKRWDVHVLTGSLKLFFRELARPLIPWAAFLPAAEILKTTGGAENRSGASKIKKILGDKMSAASFSTLRFLLSHLIKVAALSEENRMQASNLGIVFGPSLMWSDAEFTVPGNLAFNMTFQSKLVEFMLANFKNMFS